VDLQVGGSGRHEPADGGTGTSCPLVRLSVVVTAHEPAVVFVVPAPERQLSALQRVEAASVRVASAALLAGTGLIASYLSLNREWLSSVGSARLVVQALTLAVVTGASCGAGMGIGLVAASRRANSGLRTVVATALGGILPAAITGSYGTLHFGSMAVPYAGGTALLGFIVLGLVVAAALVARAEQARLPWLSALLVGVLPLPFLACLLLPAALVDGRLLALDYDAMAAVAEHYGLAVIGAVGGGILGALGGCWIGLSVVLGKHVVRRAAPWGGSGR
jgi:hypothetical protein